MSKHSRTEQPLDETKSPEHYLPKKRRSQKKPLGKIIGGIVLVLLIAVGAYGFYLYQQTKAAADKTYSSVNKKKEAALTSKVASQDPISILLLGTDTGAEGRTEVNGNSDTIIIVTVNPKTKRMTMTSIPRDTMAQMVGTSSYNFRKINAAYDIGGAKMALNSVSKLVNVPLTNYVSVNMGGLEKIVKAVGGVDVTPTLTFSYGGYNFTKGKAIHLNGKAALAYSRMRHEDPQGDYGRQTRQRQIIEAIIKSAVSTGTLANFQTFLDSISDNVTTNLTFSQMVAIFKDYRGAAKQIKSDHLQGISAWWGSASVQIAATTELQRVSDNIRSELGLTKETVNNETTRQNKLNAAYGFSFNNPVTEQNFSVYAQN
ncbi:LCP family glycopolymer transferase [Lapidilactobacillus bayanensis]|uniref:LCP family glycopolymer transferase n=1 Tax=Lapidilactobacillus bayanensis TaxID=2485998 RepID=UPI000F76DD55|nr:LCP family protein [Lapidilactobacillus bayanensis]